MGDVTLGASKGGLSLSYPTKLMHWSGVPVARRPQTDMTIVFVKPGLRHGIGLVDRFHIRSYDTCLGVLL